MHEADNIIRKNKEKRSIYYNKEANKELSPRLKYFKNLITRVLIAIIFVLGSVIYTNINDNNKKLYKSYVFEDVLSFTKINKIYQNLFGEVDVVKPQESKSQEVFFGSINYSDMESYQNGVKLTVGKNQVINVITSGIVVYIGEKENLGNTIIIQGNDGVDIWYSNITDTDIVMYDYIESGSILGTSNTEDIYLTINKDGKYLTYDEYLETI